LEDEILTDLDHARGGGRSRIYRRILKLFTSVVILEAGATTGVYEDAKSGVGTVLLLERLQMSDRTISQLEVVISMHRSGVGRN
jgi:hypothetical protein